MYMSVYVRDGNKKLLACAQNAQYISNLQPSLANLSIVGVAGAPAIGEVVLSPFGFGPEAAF